MLRSMRVAVMVPALACLLALAARPGFADDAQVRAKLLAGSSVTGKLTAVDIEGDVKKYTVAVPNKVQEVDDKAKKKYEDTYKAYMTAVQKKDANGVKRLAPELEKTKAAVYVTKDSPINIDFTSGEDVKVRRQVLPPKEVDGKKVAYTQKELNDARGTGADASLPGYAATLKDLEANIYVRVTFDRSKIKPANPKDKDAEAAPAIPITQIMIVPAPPEPKTPGGLAGK